MYLFLEYSVIASWTQQCVMALGFETKISKVSCVQDSFWIREGVAWLNIWVCPWKPHTLKRAAHYYFSLHKAFMWPVGQFGWERVCVFMCPQCCSCCFIVASKIGTCWTIGVADANSRESEVTVPLPWGFTPKKSSCDLVSSRGGGNRTVESSLK